MKLSIQEVNAKPKKITLSDVDDRWFHQGDLGDFCYIGKLSNDGKFVVRIHSKSGEIFLTPVEMLENSKVAITLIKELDIKFSK
jgi:hypothetical protein